MDTLILTQSCARDHANGREQACELTWLQKWSGPHAFIFGGRDGIPDDYGHVAFKVRAGMQLALRLGYENVFYCDTDTYVHVPHLLASDYKRAPYIGLRCDEGHASGGAGFWVSGPAIKVLAEAEPTSGYSDMWVGDHLRRAGITLTHDPRYHGAPPTGYPPDLISVHTVGSIPRMYEFHAEYKDAK